MGILNICLFTVQPGKELLYDYTKTLCALRAFVSNGIPFLLLRKRSLPTKTLRARR